MKTVMIRTVVALAFLIAGWMAGRAQTSSPEFTLEIDAPGGWTTVVCAKGCELQGGRDLGVPGNIPKANYYYACSGNRCKATVNGWLKR